MNLNCKYCKFLVLDTYYFCPNCGKKLKEPPLSTTITKQIGIYALSLLLPPLGVVPGIKYLLSNEKHAKIIGLIALILTVISIYITIYFTMNLYSQLMNQFSDLKNLGY